MKQHRITVTYVNFNRSSLTGSEVRIDIKDREWDNIPPLPEEIVDQDVAMVPEDFRAALLTWLRGTQGDDHAIDTEGPITSMEQLDAAPVPAFAVDADGVMWRKYWSDGWQMCGHGRPATGDDLRRMFTFPGHYLVKADSQPAHATIGVVGATYDDAASAAQHLPAGTEVTLLSLRAPDAWLGASATVVILTEMAATSITAAQLAKLAPLTQTTPRALATTVAPRAGVQHVK